MTSPIVSVEIGRSTWQGPAEKAPGGAGNRDADMGECFAFSAGYEAGERDGRASGQQVRALEWKMDGPGCWKTANYSIRDDGEGLDVEFCDINIAFVGHGSGPDPLGRAKRAAEEHHTAYILACLEPAPQPEMRLATREELLAGEILAELTRARAKFPGKNVTFAALVEEVGELATATFEESADRVRKEAVQVAVMAMRMILDGDHCYEPWRAEKRLDPLDPALREMEGRDHG